MAIAKKKLPAKKAAPVAAKPAAKPTAAVAKARAATKVEVEDEDDGKLDLTNVLAGCPTATIVECLLTELAKRVDYVIESKEELPDEMAALWLSIKELEQNNIGVRRALEDALVLVFPVDEEDEDALEGTVDNETDGHNVKIARKLTRSVDADKLTELSEEYEVDEIIARMFRFKPELNLAVYRAEDEETRELFDKVITTKPARPSFTITAKEEE